MTEAIIIIMLPSSEELARVFMWSTITLHLKSSLFFHDCLFSLFTDNFILFLFTCIHNKSRMLGIVKLALPHSDIAVQVVELNILSLDRYTHSVGFTKPCAYVHTTWAYLYPHSRTNLYATSFACTFF